MTRVCVRKNCLSSRPYAEIPTGMLTPGILTLVVILSALPQTVWAKPLELDPVEVKADRLEPESAEAVDTAFTTVIPTMQPAAEGEDMATLLTRTVGVGSRQSGGFGDFSAVLIRGSSAQQVAVFLDGVPLSGGRASPVDLSMFPLIALARVEVFRGMLPAEFGAEGIGGAINLIPAKTQKKATTRIMGAFGSFGESQVGVARSARHGPVTYALNLSLQSWVGDFPFYSDNGTPYTLSDDSTVRRQNNDALLMAGIGWVRYRPSPLTTLSFLESLAGKDKGLPGLGHHQSLLTRLQSLHQLFDMKVQRRKFLHPSLSAMVGLNVQLHQSRFKDPEGELGIGAQDQRDRVLSVGLLSRLTWAVDLHNLFALIPEWRFETYDGEDLLRSRSRDDPEAGLGALPSSRRYRFGVALRDRILLWRGRVRITPTIRFDVLYSEVTGTSRGGRPLENVYEDFVSPRLGARLTVVPGLQLRGNMGRYFRAPTLMELFGDRGTAVGNPELRSEKGVGGDVGAVFKKEKLTKWLPKITAQTAFFGRKVQRLIGWVQNSQRTAIAKNIAEAQVLGVEASLGAWLWFHPTLRGRLTTNYTLLWTKNESPEPLLDGNRLPGRPLHELSARLDLAFSWRRLEVAAHYAVQHISKSYLDEANLFLPVPQRAVHQVGLLVKPWLDGLSLALTLKNITDLRVETIDAPGFTGMGTLPRPLADYGGFPLPGLSFHLSLVWRT